MSDIYDLDGIQLAGWNYTEAQLNTLDPTPLRNQLVIAYDTGALTIGDGSTAWTSLKKLYIDIPNGRIGVRIDPTYMGDFYSTAANYVRAYVNAAAASGFLMKNSIQQSRLYANSTGQVVLIDDTNTKNCIVVDPDTNEGMLTLQAQGRIDVNGGLAFGSGGQLSVSTGTYNALDITDSSLISMVTGAGNVTLNGVTGAPDGHVIYFQSKSGGANDLVFAHNSGSATDQKLYLQAKADVTITGPYGTWVFTEQGGDIVGSP